MPAKKTIALVIPTLDEAENINPLYEAVLAIVPKLADYTLKLIFVDDSANDETKQSIESLQARNLQILYLEGPQQGFAKAVTEGLRFARARADVIVTLDADGSHNPEYIPAMVALLEQKVDLVVGSRYTSGASSQRKINQLLYSRSLNALLKHITRSTITDYSSGYKAMTSAALQKLDLENNRTVGYVFQVEFMLTALQAKLHIQELPITFLDRVRGSSKFGHLATFEAISKILTYYFRNALKKLFL